MSDPKSKSVTNAPDEAVGVITTNELESSKKVTDKDAEENVSHIEKSDIKNVSSPNNTFSDSVDGSNTKSKTDGGESGSTHLSQNDNTSKEMEILNTIKEMFVIDRDGNLNMKSKASSDESSDESTDESEIDCEEKEDKKVSDIKSTPGKKQNKVTFNEAVVKVNQSLCADYRSESESDSIDSESDSSSSSETTTTSSDSDDDDSESTDSGAAKGEKKKEIKKQNSDLSLLDLPPIENLKISVPEDECVEIGTILSIVETLVIVESYKGTAALDLDTVLFLDKGKRTLGRIFDILGPISEPVYAVRFNTKDEINNNDVKKGMKVYYAPRTQHTAFVFLSEIMKIKGSDASWKDNVEPPAEFQDFSDDEEERKSKQCKRDTNGELLPRKRSYNSTGSSSGCTSRPNTRFQNSQAPRGRISTPGMAMPLAGRFRCPPLVPPFVAPSPVPVLSYSMTAPFPSAVGVTPSPYFAPRISGPPFPAFPPLPYVPPGFQRPFYQQRAHSPQGPFGLPRGNLWVPPPPPPPPPPSAEDNSKRTGP